MQRVSNDIWISFGPEDNDTLRYAPACGGEQQTTLFRFDAERVPPTTPVEGQDVLVFFNGPGGFMQQPAKIVRVPAEGEEPVFGFDTTGDAVSAEGREMYRVGVVLADYEAVIGADDRCKLADVSVLGIAVFSETEYKMGDVVETAFTLNGDTFKGKCMVKSIKPTAAGVRYGLLCLNGKDAGNLEDGLRKLTMDAQRTQLKRLSRAG